MLWGARCGAQLTLQSGCAGPWLWPDGVGCEKNGAVQGGLAWLLASVTALAPCPASTSPLTRSTFVSPCRARQNRHREMLKAAEEGRGLLGGGRAQARRGSWLRGGAWVGAGCPRAGRAALRHRAAVICAPRRRLAALSGLHSIVPLRQPGSAAQLIPAAASTGSGHFLCWPQAPPYAALPAAPRLPHSAQVKTRPSLVTCPGSPSTDVNEPGLPLRPRSHDDTRVPGSTLLPPQVPDGFISHFYSVSEHVSPVLAFGFLGPKPQLAEVCAFFKVSKELRPLLRLGLPVLAPGREPGRCPEGREAGPAPQESQWVLESACCPSHWEPGPAGLRKSWDQNPRTRDSVGVPEVKGRALGGLEAIRRAGASAQVS